MALEAVDLMMGYNSLPIQAEKSLYDIAQACRQYPDVMKILLSLPGRQLSELLHAGVPPAGVRIESWQAFQKLFEQHLSQYEHVIYQLDVAHPLPVNDPSPLFETLKMYLQHGGVNPHIRQQQSAEKREQTAQAALARLKGFKLWAFKTALRIGQSMSQVREDALADIGLGYPLLRRMLHELGGRLASCRSSCARGGG